MVDNTEECNVLAPHVGKRLGQKGYVSWRVYICSLGGQGQDVVEDHLSADFDRLRRT